MRTAPHLCRPIEFVFPGYRGETPTLATLGIGIALYNALALWRPPGARPRARRRELYALAPHAAHAPGSPGREPYVDCQTDDARLVLENVLDAEAAGATVANHVRADALLRDRRGRVRGAALVDARDAAHASTSARAPWSAPTGPFTDSFLADGRPRLRPTLGVHIVFDAARVPTAAAPWCFRSPRDNRLFFVLPAGARTIVGTTDTDCAAGAAHAAPRRRHPRPRQRRRLSAGSRQPRLPRAAPGADDVLSTFAALRPLLATGPHALGDIARARHRARPDGVLTCRGRQADDHCAAWAKKPWTR